MTALLLAALLATGPAGGGERGEGPEYIFAWPFVDPGGMAPRGGTTRGPEVTLAAEPSPAWEALQAPGVSARERDRRAILAMAGSYRTSFDFLEVAGFTDGYAPPAPYRSWGTEHVYVVAEEPRFISLQHILVTFVEKDSGELDGPFVVKHWRQDWRYEDTDLHEHVGANTWQRRELAAETVRGAWTQTVYQVDDSPRYASWGRWRHEDGYSAWESAETWRPLPRREFSVRDDYDVLVGTNRHSIVPGGWTHEESNLKVALAGPGELRGEQPILAREIGVNRYQRIEGFDFSAGHAYWERTAPFWADVRAAWRERFVEHERLVLRPEAGGRKLLFRLLGYAADLPADSPYDEQAGRAFIERVLGEHVSGAPVDGG